jgi:hypothetical protein
MHRLTLCLCLAASPAWSGPDIFDVVTGVFDTASAHREQAPWPEDACDANPVILSFSTDRTRLLLRHNRPYETLSGKQMMRRAGTVTAFDDNSLTFLPDDQTSMGADDKPLQWTYHLVPGLDGFCISYGGQPAENCLSILHRCPGAAPVS